MDVLAAATDMGRGLFRRTFNIDEQGVLKCSELELLDERGKPSSRLRYAPDGTLLSEEIYEYRANGELSAVYGTAPW
ncbi:MAG: hypothetical protein U0Z75_03505 [Deinococcaceae bacterium]